MKTKDVIGQRIVAVEQHYDRASGDRVVYNVESLVLENGVHILLSVAETEHGGHYIIKGEAYRPEGSS